MAENLNYKVEGSRCYGDNTGSDNLNKCTKYGRLYDWATAMGSSVNFNSSILISSIDTDIRYRGVCPFGWHVPSDTDWNILVKYVNPVCSNNGESCNVLNKLKALSDWNDYDGNSGNGTDDYGFTALPGGYGDSNGGFGDVGDIGNWWSASEHSADSAGARAISKEYTSVFRGNTDKDKLSSVRCVKD